MEYNNNFNQNPPMDNYNNGYNNNYNNPNGMPGRPPKSYLLESILVTIFCCLPLGVVGIVNASRVESRFYRGDYFGAERAAEDAKKFTTIAFIVGIIVNIMFIIIEIIGLACS